MPLTTTPYPYQRKAAAKIEVFGGRALVGDDMGLGKTFEALLWARRNPEVMEHCPIIVVTPAGLKWSWEREAMIHMAMQAHVLETRRPIKRAPVGGWKILVINYEILDAWLPLLRSLKPKLVIVDECHMISNMATKRYKAVKTLVEGVPHLLCLSGTPLTNQPAELFPTLNLLRPDLFPSFGEFVHEYTIPKLTPWGWTFARPRKRKLPKLHRFLKKNVMIRRLKEDVLHELPEKTRVVVPLEITAKARKEYDRAERDFIGWLKLRSPAKAKRASRAEQVTKVSYLKRLIAKLKTDRVCEWIDNFLKENDGKLVVFGVHRSILEGLQERYSKISVLVNGSVKGRKRQQRVDRFRDDKNIRLFFGNMKSAGVGLNGLTAANHCAFIEFGWTPGEHNQAEDRIHRIGQVMPAFCHYLVVRNTIEDRLCSIIHEKQKTLTTILDGKGALNLEQDVMAILLNDLARRAA